MSLLSRIGLGQETVKRSDGVRYCRQCGSELEERKTRVFDRRTGKPTVVSEFLVCSNYLDCIHGDYLKVVD